MKKAILLFSFLISVYILHAELAVYNTQLRIREYDQSVSSGTAIMVLPNGSINYSAGIATISFTGSALGSGSTNYIQNRSSLQAGSTFYTSSGTADTLYQSGYQVLDISGSTQTKTGGLNVMGNVGIGTSNPLAKFSINGGSFAVLNTGLVGVGTYLPTQPFESRSSLATGFFHRRTAATASNGGGFISVGVDDGAATSSGDRLGGITFFGAEDTVGTVHNPVSIEGFASEGWNSSTGGGHLTFNTNDNGLPSRGEKMRLTHNGNLGIGTTSPSAALHVSSSAYFATGTGNVGVGTSVSSSKLHIVPDLGYSSGWLRGIVSTGANVIENGNVAIGLHTDKSMYFMTKGLADYTTTSWGNSVAMKVQGDGNVGIGSIYPETNLHISGSIPVLTLQGANEFLGPQFRFRGSAGTLSSPSIPTQPDFYAGSLYWDAYNGSAWKGVGAFLVNGDGTPSATSLPTSFNFLTTSPNAVDANVKAQINSTGDFFVGSINSADTSRLGVGTFSMNSGAQLEVTRSTFVVQTAGNVGIGTFSPTQRLHIADQTTAGAVALLQSFRSSSGSNSQVVFNKARGTITSPSAVTNGDSLGQYAFNGYDGSAYIPSAAIVASVDGGTGANDMPGRIGFRTTPDGASATLERMAINNGGYVGIGTSDPQARLNVFESQGSVLGTLLSSNFGHYIRMIPGTCDGCYSGLVKQGDNVIIYSSGTANTGGLVIGQWRSDATLNGMRFDPGGNIGIGTTSPDKRLHVVGATTVTPADSSIEEILKLSRYPSSCCNKGSQFSIGLSYWENPGNNYPRTRVDFRTSGRTTDDYTTPTTIMSLQDTGNVGIGTTNPGSKLEVNGNIRAKGDFPSGGGGYQFSSPGDTDGGMFSNSDGTLDFYTDNSPRVRINSSGSVGIGTTNPGAALDVKSNGPTINLTGTDHTYIQFYPDGAAAGRKGYLGYPGAGIDDIYVANEISGADIILLTNGGNVGIGSTAPTAKLDVNGSVKIIQPYSSSNPILNLTSSDAGPPYQYTAIKMSLGSYSHYIKQDLNDFIFQAYGDVGTYGSYKFAIGQSTPVVISYTGNVGIGTTGPAFKLHVHELGSGEGARLQLTNADSGTTSGDGFQVLLGGTEDAWVWNYENTGLHFGTNSTERMTILAGGNVGIGTNNPAYKLELSADSAGKPTTNTWTITSDSRTKEAIQDYSVGLDRIRQIRPITFTHNGKGGTPKGASGIGILAHEIKTIFPGTVIEQERVFESTDDVKGFDYEKVLISSAVTRDVWSVQNGPEDILTGTTYYQLNGGGNALVFKNNNFYFLFPIGKTGRYNEVKNNANVFLYNDEQGHSMLLQKQTIEVTPEKPGYKTKVLSFNSHELTFALINAVKELLNKIDNLDNRLRILEGR